MGAFKVDRTLTGLARAIVADADCDAQAACLALSDHADWHPGCKRVALLNVQSCGLPLVMKALNED